jgi:hypothetical protein
VVSIINSQQTYIVSQNTFFKFAPLPAVVALRVLEHKRHDNVLKPEPKVSAPFPGADDSGHFGGNYTAIQSLLSHIEQFPVLSLNENIFIAVISNYCLKRTLDFDVLSLVHHVCQLRTNGYAVTELISKDKSTTVIDVLHTQH